MTALLSARHLLDARRWFIAHEKETGNTTVWLLPRLIDEPTGLTAQGLAECFFEALDEINTPKPTAAATPAPAAIVVPSMPLCTGSGWPLTYDGGFVFGSRIDDVEIFDVHGTVEGTVNTRSAGSITLQLVVSSASDAAEPALSMTRAPAASFFEPTTAEKPWPSSTRTLPDSTAKTEAAETEPTLTWSSKEETANSVAGVFNFVNSIVAIQSLSNGLNRSI
jgi:hypothetical protein